eukprot:Amastigsp_a679148_104.p2 type:complete len:128 gc:universal Amastigsp_a679148_104:620-1003(+)
MSGTRGFEQKFAIVHLDKDATERPDVDRGRIAARRQHDLRGAILSRHHILGERSFVLLVLDLDAVRTREPKVDDSHRAIIVQHDVAGLEVTMDQPCRVDARDPFHDPIEQVSKVLLAQRLPTAQQER